MAWLHGRRISEREESAAVRRAKAGDRAALNAVIENRYGMARTFARRIAPPADWDDVTQEMSLSLWKSFRRFRVPDDEPFSDLFSAVIGWGFKQQQGNLAAYAKSARHTGVSEPLPDEATGLAAPEGPDRAALASLHDALAALEPVEREVVRLYHGIGCEPHIFRQVGRAVGTSETTARDTYRRALAKLGALLGAGV